MISGIGQSAIGRRLGRDELDLTIEAALAAIADAGLTVADIDGLAAYPGGAWATPAASPDRERRPCRTRCGCRSTGTAAAPKGPAQIQAVINAVMAVSMGLARHVLVYRTVTESTAQGSGGRAGIGVGTEGIGGPMQWSLPFRAYSAANWLAMNAQRHFHEFGTTREQMAQIALNARRNAGLNPNAIFREPMSIDDYFAARMITTPFCLFDCDVPVDGSTAVSCRPPSTRRGRPSGRAGRGGRHRAARPAVVGPVGRHDDDAGARRRRAHVVAHRPAARRRRRGRALRRLQLARDGLARGARLLRARRERAVHRGRQARSRSTASCRSTRTAGSCRPGGCTASAFCTKLSCSCAVKAATGRSRAIPKSPS